MPRIHDLHTNIRLLLYTHIESIKPLKYIQLGPRTQFYVIYDRIRRVVDVHCGGFIGLDEGVAGEAVGCAGPDSMDDQGELDPADVLGGVGDG